MNPDRTVGRVWVMRRAGIEGASTIPNRYISCELMPKDDFRGASSEHEMISCIVTVQMVVTKKRAWLNRQLPVGD